VRDVWKIYTGYLQFDMQILLDVQDILTPEHEHHPFHELHQRLDREIATKEMFEQSWSTPFKHVGGIPEILHKMTHHPDFTNSSHLIHAKH
jgi:hypothetical protein